MEARPLSGPVRRNLSRKETPPSVHSPREFNASRRVPQLKRACRGFPRDLSHAKSQVRVVVVVVVVELVSDYLLSRDRRERAKERRKGDKKREGEKGRRKKARQEQRVESLHGTILPQCATATTRRDPPSRKEMCRAQRETISRVLDVHQGGGDDPLNCLLTLLSMDDEAGGRWRCFIDARP